MAEVKELQVGFRKTVSDGNYGNETHEARLTVTLTTSDAGIGLDEMLAALATTLEGHVNSRFWQSPNEQIRYAMESTSATRGEARPAAQAAREAGSYFVDADDVDAEDEDGHDECPA
jgi:hypothetical protein